MSDPDEHPRAMSPVPPDELVLAAIERASRHQARADPGVPVWAIFEHLAIRQRSGAARHVHTRLATMRAAGWIERSRRHGVSTWALTGVGVERLREALRAGQLPPLPESPQHRAWRRARVLATEEIDRFRGLLDERLRLARLALDAQPPPHSDTWLELAQELRRACQRLSSASYCLYEWAEPDDARADVDERVDPGDAELEPAERARRRARRAGRRNVRLWDGGPGA
jgi:hypothetical protein